MNRVLAAIVAGCAMLMLSSCEKPDPSRTQGYVEGEFVYVAAPDAGQLKTLAVARGDQVEANGLLFELGNTPQTAARDEAASRVAQQRATIADLQVGARESEIKSVKAQIKEAAAALELSAKQFERQQSLVDAGAASTSELDAARAARDRDVERVSQLQATLETAQSPARKNQIAAAEGNLRALQATLSAAEWKLSQTRQLAPEAGIVIDTLYRAGDWVKMGEPVVSLLPPTNMKVRTFVSQSVLGGVHVGDQPAIHIDGVEGQITGTVSYIAPRAEYTPPVIYSQQERAKFVFLVELSIAPEDAAKLHPGQPVDVRFNLASQ